MEKKRRRLIYPGIYKISWFLRSFAYFIAERTPAITGEETPRMGEEELTS